MTTTIIPGSVKDRVGTLGGSDAAAILGQSPYSSLLRVYEETIGTAQPQEENENLYWGTVFEDLVANRYTEDTGRKLHRVTSRLEHPHYPFIAGHLDRRIVGSRGGWEGKTTGSEYDRDGNRIWGEAGTDEIPPHVIIQVMVYMAITGYEFFDVSVLLFLFGRRDFRTYRIGRDDSLCDAIVDALCAFWSDHVEPRIPPDPSTMKEAGRRWGAIGGATVLADMGMMWDLVHLGRLNGFLGDSKALQEKLKLRTAFAMETAETLLGPDRRPLVTWKQGAKSRTFRPSYKAIGKLSIPEEATPPDGITQDELDLLDLIATTTKDKTNE